jgi:hypothetical protein
MNRMKDFRGPHGPRLYETVGLRDGKRDLHAPGKADRKCPQDKAVENNLFRSNFCRFGYMKLSVEKDAAEVQWIRQKKNSKVANELAFGGDTGSITSVYIHQWAGHEQDNGLKSLIRTP